MQAVPDRDRWLALGLLAAALAAVYLLCVHPWWTVPMRDADARIEAAQARAARATAQLAQAGEISRRLQAARVLDARAPAFLPEATVELATAALAQRLETEVARASPGHRGCAITNRSPAEQPPGDARRAKAGMHVRLRCGNAELGALLQGLEGGHPVLFVDNLSVVAQGFFEYPGQGAARAGGLDVEFDLYGYLRPAAVAAPAANAGADVNADASAEADADAGATDAP
jgi:general secretion pathway protein M